MPKPPAAFSPLTMTRSSLSWVRRAASRTLTTSRPGLPIMSPKKRRFMPRGSSEGAQAVFGQHHDEPPIMHLCGKRGDFLPGIGDADGRLIQSGDGAIVNAAAIAQTVTAGVKGQQRHQQ